MKKPTDTQRIKIAAAIFALLVLIAIVSTILIYVPRIGKVALITKYAPFTSEIYLGDTKIPNNTTNYLPPGTYNLSVKHDHFTTNTETITITNDSKYLIGKLIASDSEGEQITIDNQYQFLEVEGIFGELTAAAGAAIKQQYPILNHLPINNNFYSIYFSYQEDGSPKITIKTTPQYTDIAVQKLLSLKNINLTDYDITFTPETPFQNPADNTAEDPTNFIRASYPNIIENYQISEGKTIDNYYRTTVFTPSPATNDNLAHYKIILQKTNSTWTLAATPQPLLTTKNSPGIPANILTAANKL